MDDMKAEGFTVDPDSQMRRFPVQRSALTGTHAGRVSASLLSKPQGREAGVQEAAPGAEGQVGLKGGLV